jgi:hypothetical protein
VSIDPNTNRKELPPIGPEVEHATDSKPVSGEDLLESEDLKRQLREAKSGEATSPKDGREDRKS